jgi:TetR/AcrR family transcriptional regulator
MMKKNRNTEEEIIIAARIVFHEKGYKEATMRDIASKAQINMAMLHYYYRSKDNLFFIIFDEAFRALYDKITTILTNETIDIFDKIRKIVAEYIQFFRNNPSIPHFIIGEAIRNPNIISKRMKDLINPAFTYEVFKNQLQREIDKGTIRPISAISLVLNIISLCVFPAIAKPILKEFMEPDTLAFETVIETREKDVAELIINSIKI